jgi:drug/metabolite transporter superfamily protein YnfA
VKTTYRVTRGALAIGALLAVAGLLVRRLVFDQLDRVYAAEGGIPSRHYRKTV